MSYLQAIETAVPANRFSQSEIELFMRRMHTDKEALRYINQVYANSGITNRYSVIEDFDHFARSKYDSATTSFSFNERSTKWRNELYAQESPKLVVEAVQRLYQVLPDLLPDDVTHVITVSCTGFTNPGSDIDLIHRKLLPENVERYHVGFMGCYGAFPALRMADQFCRANPRAKVLVVAIELCTIHMQLRDDLDAILGNSLFADGCAAALITGDKPDERISYSLDAFDSAVLLEGNKEMAWSIGDTGFDMVLTKYVSRVLGLKVRPFIERLKSKANLSDEAEYGWAIHPGGKSVLDRIESALELPANELSVSRKILDEYGNMSSVTILFVLKEFLDDQRQKLGKNIISSAFGPGLTVQSAVMTIC